ncbi:MAG: hypothetical protein ABII01_02290 [Candidatus Woesearchaeota archaeon]
MPLEDLTEPDIKCVSDAYKHFNRTRRILLKELRQYDEKNWNNCCKKKIQLFRRAAYSMHEQRILIDRIKKGLPVTLETDEKTGISVLVERELVAVKRKGVRNEYLDNATDFFVRPYISLCKAFHIARFLLISPAFKKTYYYKIGCATFLTFVATIVGTPTYLYFRNEARVTYVQESYQDLEFLMQHNDIRRARTLCDDLMKRMEGKVDPRLQDYKEKVWGIDQQLDKLNIGHGYINIGNGYMLK